MRFRTLLNISRPRFWIYLLGPVLIGSAAVLTQGGQWSWYAFGALLIFTLPANLFIYGVNDIFDRNTDLLNPKKQGYEQLLQLADVKTLWRISVACLVPFLFLFFFLPRPALFSLLAFLSLGAFYSAPPVRAKARAFFDSCFNILYVFPALIAWYAFGGGSISLTYFFGACFWCMAMHAYSAVPDIDADRAAGLNTIAVKLGKQKTLFLCTILYALSAIFAHSFLHTSALIIGAIYIELMFISSVRQEEKLMDVYKWFPWLNTLVGALIFVSILAQGS